MSTENSARSRLLEAASGDLNKTRTPLCSCRRMTVPLDAESQ